MAIHTALQLLLLLLSCIATTTTIAATELPVPELQELQEIRLAARASGSRAPRNQQSVRKFPAANCPNKCGDLLIEFPFGFALICDNTTQPPRLYLRDRIAEVLHIDNDTPYSMAAVSVKFSIAISMSLGANVYNASLKIPSSNFAFQGVTIDITVCDFYAYLNGNPSINPEIPFCTKCDGPGLDPSTLYGDRCTTRPINMGYIANVVQLKFVPIREARQVQRQIAGVKTTMSWNIDEQPTCVAALADADNFACISNHSSCVDTRYMPGYLCDCDNGYKGNPYILSGCSSLDHGYNPLARDNVKCSPYCGKIKVPFPFGLQYGCSAKTEFLLHCKASSLHPERESVACITNIKTGDACITKIDTTEGFFDTEDTFDPSLRLFIFEPFYVAADRFSSKLEWVIANLTCQEARQDISTYACVSPNSECLHINSTLIGYRCRCNDGYAGNPYVTDHDSCQDSDECKVLGHCKGVCHNTNGSYTCTKCPGEYDTTKKKCALSRNQIILSGIAIGLGIGFGLILLGLGAMFILRGWRRGIQNKLKRKYFAKNHGLLLEQLISSSEDASERTKIFSLVELEQATNNFDHTRILGRGGHGMVYKGILCDQRVVAIKKSKVIEQGEIDQFINEVAILSQTNHRNIVKLYGCCLETEVPLLVYDFVPNGSLFEILHSGSSNSFSLSWDVCLRIAAQAAGALYYLHSAASISVFHRDVKSSNILLDANYTAKVSDFGASRLVDIDQTHVTTNVHGTFGYLDPEYFHSGQLNEKSDVYSFGVVLLELILRTKPVFTGVSGSAQSLSSYFLGEMQERPIKEIVTAQVREEATEEELINVASLAEMCLRIHGEERPTMKEVEMSLQLLLTKRLMSSHVTPENGRAEAGLPSHSGNRVGPVSEDSQRCYSLEQEFMSSASLPR